VTEELKHCLPILREGDIIITGTINDRMDPSISLYILLQSVCRFRYKVVYSQAQGYVTFLVQFMILGVHMVFRAGTIRSAAVSIRIRYGPCRYDTYSIRYTCTLLKVSKSRISDFNNRVYVLGRSSLESNKC